MTKPTRTALQRRLEGIDHQAEWLRHVAGMPSYRGEPIATLRRVK